MKAGLSSKRIVTVGILIAFVFSLGALVPSAYAQEETVVVGTSAGFPPFEIVEEGELVGFDIDLMEAIADVQGFELEWKDVAFSALIPSLKSGKIDCVAAAMTIKPKREEVVDFSDPYWSADQGVIVGEDSELNIVNALTEKKVGAQTGTTGADWVKTQLVEKGLIAKNDLRHYDTYVMAVRDLVNGNIGSVVVDTPVARTFTERQPVKMIATLITGEKYGLAVKKGNAELLEKLNEGLKKIRQTGRYGDIVAKWFGS